MPPSRRLEIRELLLESADLRVAMRVATDTANRVNDELNLLATRGELTAATSLVARALAARAIVQIAGSWAADLLRAPEPETNAAIRSIADDPPVEIEGFVLEAEV